MLLFFHSVAQLVEIFLGIWAFQKMYPEKREHSIWLKAIVIILSLIWVALSIWNTWVFFLSNLLVIANSLFMSVLIFAIWKVFYFQAFAWEAFYNIMLAFAKVSLLILEGTLEQKTLREINLRGRNFIEVIWCFALYFIIFMIIFIKKDMQQVLKAVLCEHKGLLCVGCGIEWGILSYSMYLGRGGFSTIGFVLHSVFVLCTVLVVLYLIWYVLYQKVKVEKSRLDTFQNMLEKQNQVLQEIYNQNNKKMHDVKHVMLYLSNCLKQGKIAEAQEEISHYTNELIGLERRVWTGFSFLDFILNFKKAEMDKEKILFKLEVDLYSIPLEESELGIVLGNLFDNAIEAARQCELQKRNIYLKIGNMNQMFLLYMRNSSTKMPQLRNGRFLTLKKEHYAHGLGVESVKRIVEKQNGSISFQYDEEHFEVTILI